jgi:hypothetical protein
MAVTTVAKPGDFAATFTLVNRTIPQRHEYGILANGSIYRQRFGHDADTVKKGGRGTWVYTGVVIPDIASAGDM